jgi:hypothetical protein
MNRADALRVAPRGPERHRQTAALQVLLGNYDKQISRRELVRGVQRALASGRTNGVRA